MRAMPKRFGNVKIFLKAIIMIARFAGNVILRILRLLFDIRPIRQIPEFLFSFSRQPFGVFFLPFAPIIAITSLHLMRARRRAPIKIFRKTLFHNNSGIIVFLLLFYKINDMIDHMTREKLQMSFFIGLLLTTATVAFLIFLPYFDVLVVAAVLAIIFDPLYIKILAVSQRKEWLASLFTIFIIVLIVLIPLSLFGVLVWQEAAQFYGEFTQNNGQDGILIQFGEYLNAKLAMISPALSLNAEQIIRQTASWILENTGAIFSSVAQFVFGLFL